MWAQGFVSHSHRSFPPVVKIIYKQWYFIVNYCWHVKQLCGIFFFFKSTVTLLQCNFSPRGKNVTNNFSFKSIFYGHNSITQNFVEISYRLYFNFGHLLSISYTYLKSIYVFLVIGCWERILQSWSNSAKSFETKSKYFLFFFCSLSNQLNKIMVIIFKL